MKSNPIIIKKGSGAVSGGGRVSRVAIPGVFPSSSRFGEQVVKLRVPSLDSYIGRGIPIGSVCLIRDEFPSKFGDMILKSFIADGATHNHRLYIASGHTSPEDLSKELPSIRKSSSDSSSEGHSREEEGGSGGGGSNADLKIAWRYGQSSQPELGGGLRSPRNSEQNLSSFDFSKTTTAEELGGKNVHLSKCCDQDFVFHDGMSLGSCSGDDILREILSVVEGLDPSECEKNKTKPPNNVARIAISHCEEQVLSENFMWKLRSIVQHTNSCAVITVSDALYQNKYNGSLAAVTRAEHFSDVVISLQTIVDQKRRSELGGIDGVCNLKKVASNNTLKIFEPPKDIGFSFKKKRLLFHELHLPPEGETTTQREVSSSSIRSSAGIAPASSGSCGTTVKGKSIDF